MEKVQHGHAAKLGNEHPLLLEDLVEAQTRVQRGQHHPRLLDHHLGEDVQALIDPHDQRHRVHALQEEVVLSAVDLAQVQHLHRIHKNVARVMELEMTAMAMGYEEDDETVLVVAVIRFV